MLASPWGQSCCGWVLQLPSITQSYMHMHMTKLTRHSCQLQAHPRNSSPCSCWRCTGRRRVAPQVSCGVAMISKQHHLCEHHAVLTGWSLTPCSLLAVMPAVGLGNGGFCSAYTQKGFHAANNLVGLFNAYGRPRRLAVIL